MAREMKDSGVEWIGEIPATWTLSKIGSLYAQRNEKVSDKDFAPLSVTMKGIVPQLETAAKTDDGDNRKLVRNGDFAINSRSDRRGSCGISAYDGSVSLINIILMPRGEMHPGYYDWLFHTSLFADEFYKWGHGIVDDLWTTRWQEMKAICVPVPPYYDQERISSFLNGKCAEINVVLDKTRASIEEYKKLKQAIITQAVTKGIRGDRPMKESGIEWIGKIPVEWETITLKKYIDILPGYAFSSQDFDTENGIPLLRGINVGLNEIRWEDVVYWNKPLNELLETFCLEENDIVVGLDRPWIAGGTRVAYVQKCDLPCLLLQRVCRIRPKADIDSRLIRYWISSEMFKEALSNSTTGVSVPHISTKQIEQFVIAIPPDRYDRDICDQLDKQCEKIDVLIQKKERLLVELELYKKSMIYEYVTGKKGFSNSCF